MSDNRREELAKLLTGPRGATCHELAAALNLPPRRIGKWLRELSRDGKIEHLRNEREGQRVVRWKP